MMIRSYGHNNNLHGRPKKQKLLLSFSQRTEQDYFRGKYSQFLLYFILAFYPPPTLRKKRGNDKTKQK